MKYIRNGLRMEKVKLMLPPREVKLYKRNKLVRGVGVNDADYNVIEYRNVCGKKVQVWICPFYQTWVSMLNRCYSEKYHQRQPTYRGCKVCDEWLIFSNFKRWMEQQDWEGKQLDKDLLVEGNKTYSPEFCVFVHQLINKFANERCAARGQYMIGANWHKRDLTFQSNCRNPFTGKLEHLGYFDNELEAHLAWKSKKHEFACQLADSEYCDDERVANALRTRYGGYA